MTLLDEPSAIEDIDAQLLFKEARRRRRRLRMIRSFFAVAVVLAVLLVGFEPHAIPGSGSRSRSRSYPLDSRPPLASGASTGATLVYAQTDLRVINADTGASRSLLLPRPKGGSSDLSMVRIGSSLLLNRGNTAWLYRPGLLGPPVNLGPSLPRHPRTHCHRSMDMVRPVRSDCCLFEQKQWTRAGRSPDGGHFGEPGRLTGLVAGRRHLVSHG